MERSDIYEMLKKDHRAVENLYREILEGQRGTMGMAGVTGAEGPMGVSGSPQMIFSRLYQELTAHMEAEERTFYAELENKDETRGDVQEARREHDEIRNHLRQVQGQSPGSQEWMSHLQQAQRATVHHVQEEEGKFFNDAQKVLSEQQAREIGMRWQQEKMRIMSAAGRGPGMGPGMGPVT
ncbi:MAG: hemerythrin domain-containing protein [Chloroflexota bacterium]